MSDCGAAGKIATLELGGGEGRNVSTKNQILNISVEFRIVGDLGREKLERTFFKTLNIWRKSKIFLNLPQLFVLGNLTSFPPLLTIFSDCLYRFFMTGGTLHPPTYPKTKCTTESCELSVAKEFASECECFCEWNAKMFALAAEIPCEWKFATKFASECGRDGLVHSGRQDKPKTCESRERLNRALAIVLQSRQILRVWNAFEICVLLASKLISTKTLLPTHYDRRQGKGFLVPRI